MKLSKIVCNINYKGISDDREISYITHDSRKVKKGTLFIALKGIQSDGHDYIFDAIDKGAIAINANGRAPATNKVPILQVNNPRKAMSKIASNFFTKSLLFLVWGKSNAKVKPSNGNDKFGLPLPKSFKISTF